MSYVKKLTRTLDDLVLAGVADFLSFVETKTSLDTVKPARDFYAEYAKTFQSTKLKKDKSNRAKSAYVMFSNEKRAEVTAALKAEMGDAFKTTAVMTRISKLWKEQGDAWKAANAHRLTKEESDESGPEPEPEPVPAPKPAAKGRKAKAAAA